MHNYHHHDSWSNYVDHSNNYKMKVNGVRPNHYYPQQQQPPPPPPPPQQQQQQQIILTDGSATSVPTTSSTTTTNVYCAPQTAQYDIRRCDTNIPQTTTATTNIQNSYGKYLI